MIDGLKPYTAYKKSGLPWLGAIPEHWDVRRGKSVFRCVDVRSQTGDEELLTVSSDRGVVPRSTANVTMFKAESYVGYKLCWPGDLVINSLWAWGRGLGVSQHHGIVSTAYGVYRLRGPLAFHSGYIHALVRSSPFNWELTVRSKGIWISRLQLTDQAFLNAPFPVPPPEEQAAVVRFLAHVDRRIRRYIRAKRQLIALLDEQKQAVIHRAVTRGLDPSVRLKSSGVEWLGDVPKDWVVTRVKFASRKISKGDTPSNFGKDFVDDGPVRFIKIENIGEGELIETPLYTIDFDSHEKLARSQLQENDIVFAIAGATTGKSAIVRAHQLPANTNQAVAFIRPNDRVVPEFLVAWLHQPRLKEAMWLQTVQSAQPNLSMENLGNLPIPALS